MITSRAGLEQTRRQLKNMEDAVADLMSEAKAMHPSQLALQLEGPLEMVRRLRSEIDEYLGIQRAATMLRSRRTRSKKAVKKSLRQL